MIENYHIKVAEEDIQLLKDKIKLTRLPDEINHKWTFGTDKTFLKDLLNTWSNDFDWRIHENKINEIYDKIYITVICICIIIFLIKIC